MAIISVGYDGSVNEAQWADMIKKIGSSDYGVVGAGHWKVTGVPAALRTVSVAVGKGWGHGIFDEINSNVTLELDVVASGFRWDLIAMRRDWTGAGGSSTIIKVNGTSAKDIPTGRASGPGLIDDQPLALVQVTAGQSQPTAVIDLRCWGGNGGMAAANVLSLNYLKSIGAFCTVGNRRWTCVIDSSGNPAWVDVNTPGPIVSLPMGLDWHGVGGVPNATIVGGGTMVHVMGEVIYHGPVSPISDGWILATLPAGMRPVRTTYIVGMSDDYKKTQIFYVSPDGAIRVGPNPMGRAMQFNGIIPLA